MTTKKIKIIIAAVLIVVLILIGYSVYKKYSGKSAPESGNYYPIATSTLGGILQNKETELKSPAPKKQTETLIAGFKLYKNSDFGFEIQYPGSWAVSEEDIVNVRGENTKAFYFSPIGGSASGGKKPDSDLRFAVLPRDGLSYGLPNNGTSSRVFIGGSSGVQQKWTLPDGRRLWLVHPQYGLYNWLEDIGRIDILSGAADPAGDTAVFEKMLSSFEFSK
ncbi:hypothetical protein HZB06_03000 [Candidatus Wolfebacteria bacterium]|nr:hypothetical protein [Candidatus Wolfebacteria bacterium]